MKFVLVKLSILICCFISYFCNGYFGFKQSSVLIIAIVMCLGAVGFDIFKSFALSSADKCYRSKQFIKFIVAVIIYLFATALSLFAAFGFYSEIKDAKSGGAKAEKLQYQSLKADKTKTLADIKALGNHRPIEAIKAQISGEESKERYWSEKLSKKCTNATSNKSKSFCDNLANLRVELAKAQKSIPKILRLEKKIEKIDEKLDGIDLTVISTSNDAQVENLAKNLKVDTEWIVFIISAMFAISFELVSGLGFYVLEGERRYNEILIQNYKKSLNQKRNNDSKPVIDQSHSQVDVNTALTTDFSQFIDLYLNKSSGSKTSISEIYSSYKDWCELVKIEPKHLNVFSRLLQKHLGIKSSRERLNGKLITIISNYKLAEHNIVDINNYK